LRNAAGDAKFSLARAVFDRVDALGTHHPHPDPPPSRWREYKCGLLTQALPLDGGGLGGGEAGSV